MSQAIRLCIVNRNYPPSPGATGYHAKKLVDHFDGHQDFQTKIITIGAQKGVEGVTYVKGLYVGRIKWRRLLSSFVESYRLIAVARKSKADFYIIMTDPAFLNFWASLLLKKEPWALWTMDLYPEAFAANGLISAQNLLYRYYQKILRKFRPNFMITLGNAQSLFLKETYYEGIQDVTTPIGLLSSEPLKKDDKPEWRDPAKITFGYIGTIGEAHDAQALIQLIRQFDEERHVAILSCSGAKASLIEAQLTELAYVHILDNLDYGHFKYIDIQIVTLLSQWTHICVPSKAISAIQHGSAVLFIGVAESDTWAYVKRAGWRLAEDYDSSAFLSNLDKPRVGAKKKNAQEIAIKMETMLEASYETIGQNIRDNLNHR